MKLHSLVPRPSTIISVGGNDGPIYTVWAYTNFPPKVGERKLTRPYIIRKSQLQQWLLRRLQRTDYSLTLCRTLFLALDFLVLCSSKNSWLLFVISTNGRTYIHTCTHVCMYVYNSTHKYTTWTGTNTCTVVGVYTYIYTQMCTASTVCTWLHMLYMLY